MNKFYIIAACALLSQPMQASNIIEKNAKPITQVERLKVQGHVGGIFWLTGLSGSGKSTIARAAERKLFESGARVIVLDGDGLRSGLNSDLKFSKEDREENIRRVTEISKILADSGHIVISALISPYEKDRKVVQEYKNGNVIYVQAKVDTCIKRDPKGLYKKALAGEIKDFTGVSAPYEEPKNASFTIATESTTPEQAADMLIGFIKEKTAKPS
jgi:adenylyl-sulfate kinase